MHIGGQLGEDNAILKEVARTYGISEGQLTEEQKGEGMAQYLVTGVI